MSGIDPARADEYLRQLQAQIDRLQKQNRELKARVDRLVEERDRLRQKRHLPWRRAGKPEEPGHGGAISAGSARSFVLPHPIGQIPEPLFPAGPITRPELRVALIVDGFTRQCFAYEFSCLDLAADHWQKQVEAQLPHLLVVESAFSGAGGSWAAEVARFGPPSAELKALVDWCRRREIPTVFWNKEDPINFDWFISSAALFDWVFTVDANLIDRYRSHLGHSRIGVMPFAYQPVIHHPPIDETVRVGKVAFAGGYYAGKHPERREQIDMLLEPAIEFGLNIFDRFGRNEDARFSWPEHYRPHLAGTLTYPQVVEAYRRYQAVLNVNTVTDSPTMCSRRVFEALACGATVVSAPALALSELLPPGAVVVVEDRGQARLHIKRLLEDEDYRHRQSEVGRAALEEGRHDYGHRLDQMLAAVLG